MKSVEGLSRDALKAEIRELRRTLWCIVSAVGGCIILFPGDLETYPGDDRAMIETGNDETNGNTTFVAVTQDKRGSE